MHSLIVVLLYLGAICSPCQYTETEIYAIESARQNQVDAVESDQALMDSIHVVFGEEASVVSVINPDEDF